MTNISLPSCDTNNKDSGLYASKTILAPMVRAGRTPLRVIALDYGADLVYTEEIVDHRLLASKRLDNTMLNTTDFVLGDEILLRIAAEERSKIVLQIGTNSPEHAVKICHKFGPDVAAIDVNMGCPKPFSVHAGMGAALLTEPVKAEQILTSMVSASRVPISCKIRVLDSHDKTMEFVRMVERCGVSALAIHGRRRDERLRHDCRVSEIKEISRALSIPVIANGGSQNIRCHHDIEQFRLQTGASSLMIARKAFTNPSIFRKDGLLSMEQEIVNFLAKACIYNENYTATKYVVQRILGSQQEFDPRGKATVCAATVREICRIWDMEERYLECKMRQEEDNQILAKRPRSAAGVQLTQIDGVLTASLSFAPKKLKIGVNGMATPKCFLHSHCSERRWSSPVYRTRKRTEDGRFVGIVTINEKQFSSNIAQPNIKMAEQVSALVALHGMQIRHLLVGDWEDCL